MHACPYVCECLTVCTRECVNVCVNVRCMCCCACAGTCLCQGHLHSGCLCVSARACAVYNGRHQQHGRQLPPSPYIYYNETCSVQWQEGGLAMFLNEPFSIPFEALTSCVRKHRSGPYHTQIHTCVHDHFTTLKIEIDLIFVFSSQGGPGINF